MVGWPYLMKASLTWWNTSVWCHRAKLEYSWRLPNRWCSMRLNAMRFDGVQSGPCRSQTPRWNQYPLWRSYCLCHKGSCLMHISPLAWWCDFAKGLHAYLKSTNMEIPLVVTHGMPWSHQSWCCSLHGFLVGATFWLSSSHCRAEMMSSEDFSK